MKTPEPLRSALIAEYESDPDFALLHADKYWNADEAGRSDILDFFRSDGPEMWRQSSLKIDYGIPTAEDLKDAFDGS